MNARMAVDVALSLAAFVAVGGHTHQTFDLNVVQWSGAALLLIAALAASSRSRGAGISRADLPLWMLIGYAAISLFWSPVPQVGAAFVVKAAFVGGLIWSFRLVFEAGREIPILIGVAGAVLQTLLLIYFPPTTITIGGFGNPNFVVEMMAMALPWIAGFALRRGRSVGGFALWGLFCVALWFAIVDTPSKVPILVLGGLGVLAVPFALLHLGKVGVAVGIAALTAVAWAASLRGLASFTRSLGERGEIFLNTLAIARDTFPWGGGAGSFGALYPLYQERHLANLPEHYLILRRVLIGAAHNDFLQAVVDYGAPAIVALFAAAALAAAAFVAKRSAWRGPALASLAAGALASLVGFPFQNPATLVLAALAVAGLTARTEPNACVAAGPGFAVARWVAGCGAAVFFAISVFNFMAYYDLRRMVMMRHPAPDSAYAAHARANRLAPWDPFIGQTLFVTYMSWATAIDRRYSDYPNDRVSRLADPLAMGPDNATIYALSRRYAPNNFNLGYGRLQYLLNARLHRTHAAEIDAILAEIRRSVPHLPETIVLSAYAAGLRNDPDAMAVVARDAALPGVRWRPEMRAAYEALAAAHARIERSGNPGAYDIVIHLEW